MSETSFDFRGVGGSGDMAYVYMNYDETYTVEGREDPIKDTGNVLAILQRQPDGSWLFSTGCGRQTSLWTDEVWYRAPDLNLTCFKLVSVLDRLVMNHDENLFRCPLSTVNCSAICIPVFNQ